MRILLVLNELVTGGAEIFTLRLAAELHARGHEVILLTLRGEASEPDLLHRYWPNGYAIHYKQRLLPVFLKIDGLLRRLRLDQSFLSVFQIHRTRQVLRSFAPDVVHSHLYSADQVVCKSLAGLDTTWVSTVHGDYIQFAAESLRPGSLVANFRKRCRQIDQRISQLIVISDPQKEAMARLMPISHGLGLHRMILNGVPLTQCNPTPLLSKMEQRIRLGLRPDSFLIVMVARGIEEKGWDVMIGAFEAANLNNAQLFLVGEGPALHRLAKHNTSSDIYFYGSSSDPQSLIGISDLSCLPSRYRSESCPMVVVESLAVGVPVLATRVGQISWMLDENTNHPAGRTLPPAPTEELIVTMASVFKEIQANPGLLEAWKENCRLARNKFSIERCADAYLEAYHLAGASISALHQSA